MPGIYDLAQRGEQIEKTIELIKKTLDAAASAKKQLVDLGVKETVATQTALGFFEISLSIEDFEESEQPGTPKLPRAA